MVAQTGPKQRRTPLRAPRSPDQDELFALVTCPVDDTVGPDVLPAVEGYRDFDELVTDLPEARRP